MTLKKAVAEVAKHFGKDIADVELSYFTFKAMRNKRITNDMEYRLCLSEYNGVA
jgi:hypothetical protein